MQDSGPRTAELAQTGTLPTTAALAIPDKGRGLAIPARHGLFQPVDDRLRRLGMLTGERPAHDDALHRFGHMQPRAGEWRGDRPKATVKKPTNQTTPQMSCNIIP